MIYYKTGQFITEIGYDGYFERQTHYYTYPISLNPYPTLIDHGIYLY